MITFELNKLDNAGSIDKKWLEEAVGIFFDQTGLRGDWSFSLALVNSAEIKKWNKIYRGRDQITDVLSFVDDDSLPDSDRESLGEIIICLSQARKQAKISGWPIKRELARLLVHGLSHLLGYDHENVSEAQAKKMFKLEDRVMKKIFKVKK
ncbi:MAG: rRNA maturation RNase YbeY [Patescibacteria group bacterium]